MSDKLREKAEENKKPAFYINTDNASEFVDFPCSPVGVADLKCIHYAGEIGREADIIPGQFEGGHRIWQGSLDLIRFIEKQEMKVSASTTVVELGCGHGLPGSLMLRRGARVYFQDLNEDSLRKATLPTIVLNAGMESISRCKLICGEWSETAAMIDATKIDYILASDTIYTPATIRSFVSVVNQLADHDTVCWIASQKYYFGLGGGTQALIDIIKEMKLPLTIKILETLGEDTVKRDIICIQKKYLHC